MMSTFWTWYCLNNFFPRCIWRGNVAFVAEPDEVIGILSHVPYHLQEVHRALSNRLTKGQTLSTHVEPKEKQKKTIKETKQDTEYRDFHSEIKGSTVSSQLSAGVDWQPTPVLLILIAVLALEAYLFSQPVNTYRRGSEHYVKFLICVHHKHISILQAGNGNKLLTATIQFT